MKVKYKFFVLGVFLLCLLLLGHIENVWAADEDLVQDPPCLGSHVDMFGTPPGGFKTKPVYYRDLDNVLLYIDYPGTSSLDREGHMSIAGVDIPAPLRRDAIIVTAIKIMKKSGLMTCLKQTSEEPLKDPILVEYDDPRTALSRNLTVTILVRDMLPNLNHDQAPYFLIVTNVFRPDRPLTPGRLVTRTAAHPIFFVGKSDEDIQRKLESALSKVGLWP